MNQRKGQEQDNSFVNEQFFKSWQNRTGRREMKGEESAGIGDELWADLYVTYEEALQEGGVTKHIDVSRNILCPSCNGLRERKGSQSLSCYSCKGEGVKTDPIFRKEVKCNTCQGFGKLVQKPCLNCEGKGLTSETASVEVSIP